LKTYESLAACGAKACHHLDAARKFKSIMAVMSNRTNVSAGNLNESSRWWTPRLAGPLIAAAVIRVMLLVAVLARSGAGTLCQGDTASYLEPGRNLLFHGRFVADGVPEIFRTPGYSIFLAITSLAGLPAAAAINVILSVFSVLLVWRLGRACFGVERIALVAAWIFAFEPVSVLYSVTLMSETLFLVLFLLSLERLAEFLRGHRLQALAVAGLWLAAATFVRPISYYLPVALALGLFIALAREKGLRWKAPAVLLISVMPWLAAWQIRNWVETGYGGFSSVSEKNLYFGVATGVTAQVERRTFDIRTGLGNLGYFENPDHPGQFDPSPAYFARHPEQTEWSQGQEATFMRSEAFRVIRGHPGVYLRLCFNSLLRTVFEPGAGVLEHLLHPNSPVHRIGFNADNGLARQAILLAETYPWIAAEKAFFGFMLMTLYVFAVRGVFRSSVHNSCLWLLLETSFYFLAVAAAGAGPLGEARFRLPVMPAVCLLAAAGFRRGKTNAR